MAKQNVYQELMTEGGRNSNATPLLIIRPVFKYHMMKLFHGNSKAMKILKIKIVFYVVSLHL